MDLYNRIKENKPSTNNPVESWHSAISSNAKTHGTMNIVLEELQLEKSKTDSHIIY